jgi:hypothetical protein
VFITLPGSSVPVPKRLLPRGARSWSTAVLSTWASWFLVTVRGGPSGEEYLQTTAVAWEETLLQVVSEAEDAIVSISIISPSTELTGVWDMNRVTALWLPHADEVPYTGPLLYSCASRDGLFDCFLNPIDEGTVERTLRLRLP